MKKLLLFVLLINCFYFTIARPDANTEAPANFKLPDLTKESRTDDFVAIPSFNFDFMSILKTLAKYEIQEEAKPAIKQIQSQASDVKEESSSAIKKIETAATEANPIYPQSSLNIVTIGQQKYYISPVQLEWMEAVSFCRMYGMDLWSWESKEEKDLIVNYIKQNNLKPTSAYYLSANKFGSVNAAWTLFNGKPLLSFDWNKGQPDGVGSEYCMYFVPSENGVVGDYPCNGNFYFICKVR